MRIVASLYALAQTLIPVALQACPDAPQAAERRLQNNTWQYAWNLNEADRWLEAATDNASTRITDYQHRVESQTRTDPFELLARQRRIFEKVYGEDSGAITSFRLVEKKEVGQIDLNTCLDRLLLEQHLQHHPLNVSSLEYSAFIHRKGTQLKVFAAFLSKPSMTAPQAQVRPVELHELKQDGWKLMAFVHNHPFSFDNPYGDIAGTILPSGPDLITFRHLFSEEGLESALITNGFHSARYSRADTDRLIIEEGL